MSQPDFERRFQQELKERELQPGAGSWDRLQRKLDHGRNRRSPRLWWLGIAAAVVGVILVLGVMDFRPGTITPSVVETPEAEAETGSEVMAEPQLAREEMQEAMLPESSEVKSESLTGVDEERENTEEPEERLAVIETSSEEPGVEETSKVRFSRKEAREAIAQLSEEMQIEEEVTDAEIDALMAEALAEVWKEHEMKRELVDTEVDALLANARAEVQEERKSLANTGLAAEELLWEVETELQQSFREQVLELLKEGFRKTKTAVANRIN